MKFFGSWRGLQVFFTLVISTCSRGTETKRRKEIVERANAEVR